MGVPTSEVGYTIATTRRETTKFVRTCGGIGKEDFLYNFETFLILRRSERDMIKNIYEGGPKITGIIF